MPEKETEAEVASQADGAQVPNGTAGVSQDVDPTPGSPA